MGIQLALLLEALGGAYDSKYIGNRDERILAVQVAGSEKQFQHDVLYIVDKDELLPTGIPVGIPALFVEKEAIATVYHQLQRTLVQALKQEFALQKLQSALLANENQQQVVDICAEMLGNPCVLFSPELAPIAASGSMTEDPLLYTELLRDAIVLQRTKDSEPVILDGNAEGGRRCMVCFLPCGRSDVCCMLFIETQRAFSLTDMHFAREACLMILHAAPPSVERADSREKLFLDLLENRYLSPFALEEVAKAFRIPKGHTTFYLLLVDTTFQNGAGGLMESLSQLVGRPFFSYQNYYATLLSCRPTESVTYTSIPGFVDFLEDHRLFATLSNGYRKLSKTSTALEQCTRTLKIGYMIRKSQHFYRFEDQMIYYIYDMLHDKDMLLDIAHPIVREIYEYDQQHQTEYLRTLGAYILLEKSTKRCADALYIHRNTLVHRIDKLRTLFNIDFSDSRMRTKLHMSALIYGYLGLVDLFVQPLVLHEEDEPDKE